MAENSTIADDPMAAFDFAGWGSAERIVDLDEGPVTVTKLDSGPQHKLGEFKATAICGNDITSSCLYVSALCALQAGVFAPVALAFVASILFLFRRIYAEVGSALPLNGGAYNVLLNTTSKGKASIAACLTLLSYTATAVISAAEAMHYAEALWHHLPVISATVGLLSLFAFLNLIGITESAVVALGIFITHMVTLTILVGVSAWHFAFDVDVFRHNLSTASLGNLPHALFFGFAAAMLGISGFESSANFIEEQKPGVFPKTLRNMWIAVAIFNPLISLLSMGVVRVGEFQNYQQNLLAHMARVSGGPTFGPWLAGLVSIDAVLVLSGAVLTSYVGVIGLVRRMSLDRCLPQFLLRENRFTKTNHWIIFSFFALCCSILFITQKDVRAGDISVLAGVYTLSFLGVMGLFAVGNMLLKVKRERLPRAERATWLSVSIGLIAVAAGFAGQVLMNPQYIKVFSIYFLITLVIVAVMFLRIHIMRIALFISKAVVQRVESINRWINGRLRMRIDSINSQSVIFFTRGDNAANLNRAALYVLGNEQTNHMKVVTVYESEEEIPATLAQELSAIDHLYPELRIDFVAVRGKFGPELIERLSRRLGVPKNYMFIGCPGDRFPHNIGDLGGVRLIL